MYNENLRNKVLNEYNNGKRTKVISEETGISLRTVQRIVKDINRRGKKKTIPYVPVERKFDLFGALWMLPEDKKPQKRVVGVFSDVHAPYTKTEYIDWLIKIFKEKGVTDIVCLGDLTDSNTISNYMKNPEGLGTLDEFNKAYNIIQMYTKAFPVCKYCSSNHDSRCAKIAAQAGIPKLFLKPFSELFNLPKTWDIKDQHIINNVLYLHGERFGNRNALLNMNQTTMMSTVSGHAHSNFGVVYTDTGYNRVFNMFVGCLIDKDSFAFEYGKNSKFYPVLGAGIVYNQKKAEVIPYDG